MSTTTNELPSSSSPDVSKGSENSRTGGAAGVEVPVVVHASRYSSAANTVGKTLPPVHEETLTVIVFEQGAVVRLCATVTAGEVVVLTNKRTGADVICKVASVKAQPGIQSYVSLEFTQRAPGFWGESSPIAPAPQIPQAEAVPTVVATPTFTARAAEPTPVVTPSVATTFPAEPVPVKLPVAPVASYEHQQQAIAPGTTEPISALPAAPAFSTPPAKVFEAGATLGIRQSSTEPVNRRPIELGVPSQGSAREGKNLALMAVAAVVLLFAGGAGAWFLMRPSQPATATAANQAATLPQAPAVASEAARQTQSPLAPDAAPPAVAQTETGSGSSSGTVRSELRADAGPETIAAQPAAIKSASQPVPAAPASVPSAQPKSVNATPATEAAHRPVLDISKISAPAAKKKSPVTSTSSEAPPEVLAQSGALAGSALNENLFQASARSGGPALPTPSVPTKSSQLIQPKLTSSATASYPAQARAANIQGDVIIDAFIDETGRVTATKVISGPPALQVVAMNAVRSWKYQPARLDGQPISIHIQVVVNFRLQ